ncbi:MAG TPA: J domain-containing protein [Acidimicrobiales bacterium]|nr:J domain-containing protein [Acidimicrobiales bacterium]
MTPHEILGVAQNASRAEIRAAYRVLREIFHPERHAGSAKAVQERAAVELKKLNEAYDKLIPKSTRRPSTRPGPRV